MLKNFVAETANSPGVNQEVSLLGAPVGRRTFASQFASGATVFYFMDDGAGQAEAGIGVITSGSPDKLQRSTVLWNTAGTTNRLPFDGAVAVYNEVPAERTIFYNADGSLSLPGTVSIGQVSLESLFYLTMASGMPFIGLDVGDYMRYNRSANAMELVIGDVSRWNVSGTGEMLTSGPLRGGAGKIISQSNSNPSVAAWHTAAGARGFWTDSSGVMQFGVTAADSTPSSSQMSLTSAGDVANTGNSTSAKNVVAGQGVFAANDTTFGLSVGSGIRSLGFSSGWSLQWNTTSGDLSWNGSDGVRMSITGTAVNVTKNLSVGGSSIALGSGGMGLQISGNTRSLAYSTQYALQFDTGQNVLSWNTPGGSKFTLDANGAAVWSGGVSRFSGYATGQYGSIGFLQSNASLPAGYQSASVTVGFGVTVDNSVVAANFYATSDRRAKDDILPVTGDEAELFMQLEPRSFRMKKTGELQYGFIAQEAWSKGLLRLVGVVPDEEMEEEVVDGFTSPAGSRLVMDPSSQIPLLHKALQSERDKNRKLEERLAKLEELVNSRL